MIYAILGVTLAATGSLGALYPHATIETPIAHEQCGTRYTLSTPDPIDKVADFYEAQAAAAGVQLFDDSADKFPDYRTLLFLAKPRFMFVLMDRKGAQTTIRVAYTLTVAPGCA